jgi:hypothetical protein
MEESILTNQQTKIYPIELEIKDITDRAASYLDLNIEIDSEGG